MRKFLVLMGYASDNTRYLKKTDPEDAEPDDPCPEATADNSPEMIWSLANLPEYHARMVWKEETGWTQQPVDVVSPNHTMR